ncbi:hypothetical protein [Sphingomonas beigongshangi]|uniref:hypothetical protein n=1 Tax=Sphingomonas beigongshangi TaxID=2782540 RepID=UPI00193BB3A2|nr:hypothetical protein [Sphingomonas beigongshangi]
MAERLNLPDWPRLMSAGMAASYLGVSSGTLQSWGIAPIETPGRRVLYDRKSLDRYADRLAGQPLTPNEAAGCALDEERAFFRDRAARGHG